MKYSSTTNNLKIRLQNELTLDIKARISQLDLIDTGKMLNSFEAKIDYDDDGLDVQFSTTDYFKYVDGNYNITDYVLDSNKIKGMMEELFGMMIEDMFMMD